VTMSFDPSGDAWEIRELVERYAAAADRVDGAAIAELFTDDGELAMWLEPGEAEPATRRGHDEIAAAISLLDRFEATQHVIASSGVDVAGDDAQGQTQCAAHHVRRTDAGGEDTVLHILYTDRFVRIDDKWRLARRELRVRWIETREVTAI
jgi:ketosteroid isomerase-like protein